ncbi:MAG: glycosyltransferase family 2 protein, partial [Planctomycetota bacterium]
MSDKKPLASILIDHYNSRDLVGETIESALAQDYEPKEIILVDDGSTDGSKDVLSHFESRIRIIYQENRGQNGALNRLVEEAKGDVFFFLDGDDLFLPGKVARIMEIYKKLDWQKKIFLFHS